MTPFDINIYVSHFEKVLHEAIESLDIPSARLHEALYYVLFPGGKRLRPLLVYLSGELLGVAPGCLDCLSVAVEFMHCYSLVHDDLPAMDNDDYRRGRLSCHRAFDEATAILVGDGLQALAYEYLLNNLPLYVSPLQVIDITQELIRACGMSGMVSGQSLDLSELMHPSVTEEQLKNIHFLKTGRFIVACINLVLKASVISPCKQQALSRFAHHLGIAFQMQDDYLDSFAHPDVLGKNRASDEANQKITFASLYPSAALLHLVNHHFEQAILALQPLEQAAQPLILFTQTLQQRSQMSVVHEH